MANPYNENPEWIAFVDENGWVLKDDDCNYYAIPYRLVQHHARTRILPCENNSKWNHMMKTTNRCDLSNMIEPKDSNGDSYKRVYAPIIGEPTMYLIVYKRYDAEPSYACNYNTEDYSLISKQQIFDWLCFTTYQILPENGEINIDQIPDADFIYTSNITSNGTINTNHLIIFDKETLELVSQSKMLDITNENMLHPKVNTKVILSKAYVSKNKALIFAPLVANESKYVIIFEHKQFHGINGCTYKYMGETGKLICFKSKLDLCLISILAKKLVSNETMSLISESLKQISGFGSLKIHCIDDFCDKNIYICVILPERSEQFWTEQSYQV